ncbi:MAG: aspartate ammonia-lyase [Candidatus Aminicenantes bacterium]|nr:aspartate ammonia-lyase [Candidatus Aminicenantes bacterium]
MKNSVPRDAAPPRAEIDAFLQAIELFQDLNPSERDAVAAKLHIVEFDKDGVLFEENQTRENLFLIYQGSVRLHKKSPLGEEKDLARFRRFDFLGEGALMDDYPHSTTARAEEPTLAFLLSRTAINELLKTDAPLVVKILSRTARVISRRMRQTTNQVVNAAAQYISGRTRREHDLLGERDVPAEFYYGIQTLRATENFPITGISISRFPDLIVALAQVKMAAARANRDLGLLPADIAAAIDEACREIIDGRMHTHFVVDMIQGGAGTSTNMNANEVIANRALEILGRERGDYAGCHPNNHVNLSQSTNDVYPTALRLAFIYSSQKLAAVLKKLVASFRAKGREFREVIKLGRTQLQDAVPMTLGQEFEAFAATLEEEIDRLEQNAALFQEIHLGGTAIGTGICASPEYAGLAVSHLREISGIPLRPAPDLVEATQDTGAFIMFSSAVKRLAVKLSKISNDLRLLSSGPRAGFHEIHLPMMQPGSSIMPGKVNPVIPEVVNQIAFKVIGNDLAVTLGAEAGQLQLNVFEPVIAQSIFESIEMLKNGMDTLRLRCVEGITADEAQCRKSVERSFALVTALVPLLGYETCSALAQEAMSSGRSVYALVLEKGLLPAEILDDVIKPENMIRPRG